MRYLILVLLLLQLVFDSGTAMATTQEDVRGIALRPAENRVIDEKCLNCHNRQKIEAARKERKNLEKITGQMEKKGVTLTDADKEVLAHFWQQNPLKK